MADECMLPTEIRELQNCGDCPENMCLPIQANTVFFCTYFGLLQRVGSEFTGVIIELIT